ncbi:MAG: hypothetical protein IKS83_06050 [Victivallales bacterium]|nr:hypothetical protein [Victivallales bacterium]
MNDYQPFSSGAWQGVHLGDFSLPSDPLDHWLEQIHASACRRYPSRCIAAPTEDFPWYVKILWGASDHDTWLNRLKWRLRPSRMLQTWRISMALEEAGFLCPKIQLAARRRAWWPLGWPTDLLIMAPIAGRQLSSTITQENATEVLPQVAAELARFHAAGFAHGDCIPGNLFLQDNGKLAFIDNDRTMHTRFGNRTARIRRNLVQFGFHLLRKALVSRDQLEEFFLKYATFAKWTSRHTKDEIPRVRHWIERRLDSEKRQ